MKLPTFYFQSGLRLVLICCLLFCGCTTDKKPESESPLSSELILEWNDLIYRTAIAEDGLMTLKGLRTAAMTHVAIHDALNSVDPRYKEYTFSENSPDADPYVAASYAAYYVLLSQYPDKEEEITILTEKFHPASATEESITAGKMLGEASANAILNKRQGDQWNSEAEYTWHPMGPGVYAEFNEHSGTPEGFIFGAGWAKAKPFLLHANDQFRSPPPPEINSDAYTRAFNEVKEVGAFNSKSRTEDQTHLAMWWKDFVENSHNRLARQLVKNETIPLYESARLFALLNMTIYDAYINVFDNKFFYNHWRPYTAIRWAENDQNSDTEPEENWNNLHQHTYAFPSYPSAHGTASSAAMTILQKSLKKENQYEFTMTTEEVDQAGPFSGKITMDPPTRNFNSFDEAAMEAALSRVYLGIHFRYDSEEGFDLGKKIGEYASGNFLNPVDGI